jgi:tetratricopeptide (TPR) repeat protein
VKGYAAPETKAAAERARLLIEQAEALGEPPEDPLLLFSVLQCFWAANQVAFNGDMARELAMQFLATAEKQGTTIPLMMGHRLMGVSLMLTGNIAQGRRHLDEAITLYDPAAHRPLATRFIVDARVASLSWRARALWLLGYPDAALADADHALTDAREIRQAATLMLALFLASFTRIDCGNHTVATAEADELLALADEKTASQWKAQGMLNRGCLLVLTGKASDAVQMLNSGIAAHRSTGSTIWLSLYLSYLGIACGTSLFDAWRCIGEAIGAAEATKETSFEADINRIAGEIALKSPERDGAKAQVYFDRALSVACQQQAKSWNPRRDEHGLGSARSGQRKRRTTCSLRCTAGSPKGSTHDLKKARRCSTGWRYEAAQALGCFIFEEEPGRRFAAPSCTPRTKPPDGGEPSQAAGAAARLRDKRGVTS